MVNRRAFTLIELLVVIAIIILLLGMISPGLWSIMKLAKVDICFNNVHQLSVAWMGYQADHDGYLVVGHTGGGAWAKYGNERPTNTNRYDLIKNGALYPYSEDTRIYLCPSDPVEHIRSYSITSVPNGEGCGGVKVVKRYGHIKDPANQIVFAEERDPRNTSNMNSFIQWPYKTEPNKWIDFVPNFHDGADNFGFGDGHAEHWEWKDPRSLEQSALVERNPSAQPFYWSQPGNPDLARIREKLFDGMPGSAGPP